ncbi:MAG: hypothetical protein QOE64_1715, partial [Frankiales bacterium]|nr:hypothetical protein [Frankiales bacterium]
MIVSSTYTARPVSSVFSTLGRMLPNGWRDLGLQLALFAMIDFAYEATRILATGERSTAFSHSHAIVGAEKSLGLFHEQALQRWAMDAPSFVLSFANALYFNAQFTISFGFLFWVYLRRNEQWKTVRNLIFLANVLGLIGYVLYPAAPPRMMNGFVDTLHATSVNHDSGVISALSNPFGAMPSLHTAYALIVGISGFILVRNRLLRAVWAVYPAMVVFSIVTTANHFFLDAVGGAVVAMVAALAVFSARVDRRYVIALAAVPAASFLVYRMAGVAADAVDSLHSVALGALALALVANFGSVALKTAVWKRAVDALPGSPRPGYRGLLPAVFIGFLGNTVLAARLGEVARVAVVSRRLRAAGTPVPAAALAGTLVAEQLALGAALLILGIGLTVTVVDLPAWALTSLVALGAVVISAVIVAVFAGRIGGRVPVTMPRRLQRLAAPAADALRASGHLSRDPRAMSAAIALGIASWALQILGIYWTLQAFGLPHTAASASAVFLISTLVGLFPLLPGNVGVFQVAVAGVLAASFGVDAASGAAFGIGLQAVEVVLGAGLGAVFLLTEGLSLSDLRRGAGPEPAPHV